MEIWAVIFECVNFRRMWPFFASPPSMNETPKCPGCNAAEVVRNGKTREKQRYKCKNCNFQYTTLTHPFLIHDIIIIAKITSVAANRIFLHNAQVLSTVSLTLAYSS